MTPVIEKGRLKRLYMSLVWMSIHREGTKSTKERSFDKCACCQNYRNDPLVQESSALAADFLH